MSEAGTPQAVESSFEPIRCQRRPIAIAGYWFGGIALFAFAIVGFVAAVVSHPNVVSFHSMTTLPVMVAIGLIAQAVRLRKTPDAILLDATGLTVESGSTPRHFPWNEIAWNEETLQPLTNRKQTILYGLDGKPLIKIADAFYDFDRFVISLNRRIKSQPHRVAEQVRLKRLKRRSWLLIGMGIGVSALCTFLFISGREEARAARRLQTESKTGTARIERKFLAPNGVTSRVEYRVDAKRADGSEPTLMNVEIEPAVWEILREDQSLPVRYVTDEPDISEPLFGYVRDDHLSAPIAPWLIGVIGGAAGLLFIGCGIMNRFGIDLVMDSETKKFRLARSVAAPILPGPVP